MRGSALITKQRQQFGEKAVDSDIVPTQDIKPRWSRLTTREEGKKGDCDNPICWKVETIILCVNLKKNEVFRGPA